MADKLYNEQSIESLSPLEFTRLRPGVYAGDTTYSTQLLVEIVSNAIDEFRLGHGDTIDVKINGDVIGVRDYGQGFIPMSFRDDGKSILEAAFSVLNTSGKYRDDGTYEGTSLGSFGIGSKITTFLSHWLTVETYRDGLCEHIKFIEGVFDSRSQLPQNSFPTGTYVEWQPSEEFFTHPEVEIDKIKSLFQTLVCLCPGLTINLTVDNNKPIAYYSKNGLNDYTDDVVGNKEILNRRFSMNFEEGKYKMDFILTYTSGYAFNIVPYVNAGLTEKGPHITLIKTLLTREFNKFFKEKKWIKDKEEPLSGDDIQEGMFVVFNITAPNVAYNAQVKSTVTKIDMHPLIRALAEELQMWLSSNEKEMKDIAEKALRARKARDAAKKARDAARGTGKKKEKALKFASKLADCYSKDRSKCEIYITEGDSASGNLKEARNNEFQAIMPVRGKILNTRKATFDKIKSNAEIMTMIEAFGLTVDLKTMKLTYRPEDLRYDKIIIESDADVDGAHIKNLFYTFIWTFCPQLILDGHVYAGVPPLYRVTEGKDKRIFLKDEAALLAYRTSHKGKGYTVTRLKGLGEMGIDDTDVLVNPELRTIHQVTVEDVESADELFDDLMGTAVLPRKKFIQEHSAEATYGV